jgi:hypothetical protein
MHMFCMDYWAMNSLTTGQEEQAQGCCRCDLPVHGWAVLGKEQGKSACVYLCCSEYVHCSHASQKKKIDAYPSLNTNILISWTNLFMSIMEYLGTM